MVREVNSVTIKILGRDYQISCSPDEEEDLKKSADYLNRQMEKVKKRGTTLSFEKLTVMTALNICHELLQHSRKADDSESGSREFLKHLEDKIDSALQNSRQYEI